MINVEKCKEILGDTGQKLTEAEIVELRDLLYLFAKSFITEFKLSHVGGGSYGKS